MNLGTLCVSFCWDSKWLHFLDRKLCLVKQQEPLYRREGTETCRGCPGKLSSQGQVHHATPDLLPLAPNSPLRALWKKWLWASYKFSLCQLTLKLSAEAAGETLHAERLWSLVLVCFLAAGLPLPLVSSSPSRAFPVSRLPYKVDFLPFWAWHQWPLPCSEPRSHPTVWISALQSDGMWEGGFSSLSQS